MRWHRSKEGYYWARGAGRLQYVPRYLVIKLDSSIPLPASWVPWTAFCDDARIGTARLLRDAKELCEQHADKHK